MLLIYQINASINFIIYVINSPKFAKAFNIKICVCVPQLKIIKYHKLNLFTCANNKMYFTAINYEIKVIFLLSLQIY